MGHDEPLKCVCVPCQSLVSLFPFSTHAERHRLPFFVMLLSLNSNASEERIAGAVISLLWHLQCLPFDLLDDLGD